jgi:hypothetical protein
MRGSTFVATTAAAAVLAAGLLAAPALANGRGPGGAGGAGGRGPGITSLSPGALTPAQQSALAGMAEEEKLAHDVYVALAKTSGDSRFTRIASSEAQHVTEIRALLTRYGIADPTAGQPEGSFATPAVQELYDSLVARGDDSPAAALAVGRDIEKLDIADLVKAGNGVTATDVRTVYTRLSNGSQNHLRAFSR